MWMVKLLWLDDVLGSQTQRLGGAHAEVAVTA